MGGSAFLTTYRWCDKGKIKFVKLSFLRQLADEGKSLPRYEDVPRGSAFVGNELPTYVDVISAVSSLRASRHPDPEGELLKKLVEMLGDGSDDDGPYPLLAPCVSTACPLPSRQVHVSNVC